MVLAGETEMLRINLMLPYHRNRCTFQLYRWKRLFDDYEIGLFVGLAFVLVLMFAIAILGSPIWLPLAGLQYLFKRPFMRPIDRWRLHRTLRIGKKVQIDETRHPTYYQVVDLSRIDADLAGVMISNQDASDRSVFYISIFDLKW